MVSRMYLLVICTVLLTFAGFSRAASDNYKWYVGDEFGTQVNLLWSTPENWYPVGVPTFEYQAWHDKENEHIVIEEGIDAECEAFVVGTWGDKAEYTTHTPAYLDITGGSLTATLHGWIGHGHRRNRDYGLLNLSGGTVNIGEDLILGVMTTAWGEINMTDGSLNIGDSLWLCYRWDTFNDYSTKATVYLNGGTINAKDLESEQRGSPLLDIGAGQLVLAGDKRSKLIDYINEEAWIIGYNHRGRVSAAYDDVSDETTVSAVYCPDIAYDPNAPSPASRGDAMPYDTMLSWVAGDTAVAHNVYVSDVFEDIQNAVDSSSPYCVADGITECWCSPTLTYGGIWYWRVDEVNGDASISRGNIWTFRTDEYLPVENFESYRTTAELKNVWKAAADAYITMEKQVIYDGGLSLELQYDNNGDYYSDAYCVFDGPQNWTVGGLKALVLYFHGQAGNDPEKFSVILEDADGHSAMEFYDGDESDLVHDIYDDWRIFNGSLQAFEEGGVDLSKVEKLTIRIGETGRTQPGGSGTVYIDAIRVYPLRCVPKYTQGDITGDCKSDCDDITMLVENWLLSALVETGTPPDDERLVVYYNFDETEGSVAYDTAFYHYPGHSSDPNISDPNTYNGLLISDIYAQTPIEGNWDPNNGVDGTGCLHFLESNDDYVQFVVEVPVRLFEFVDQDMTMSLWIYGDDIQPEENWGVLFEGWCPTWSMESYAPDPAGDVMWWTSEGVLYWKESTSTDWKGQWNHYAFVSDSAAEKLTLYCNGEVVEQTDGYLDRISDLQTGFFTLGAWYEGIWGVYRGRMDEFRIYNYALAQDEILTLAHQSEVYQPLLYPEVDLAEDGKINILDFAVLASRWLERELWP